MLKYSRVGVRFISLLLCQKEKPAVAGFFILSAFSNRTRRDSNEGLGGFEPRDRMRGGSHEGRCGMDARTSNPSAKCIFFKYPKLLRSPELAKADRSLQIVVVVWMAPFIDKVIRRPRDPHVAHFMRKEFLCDKLILPP
jgi:hypothetical protein